MKQISCLYYTLACILFLSITACEKDNQVIEDEIPVGIKSDFTERCPSAEILTYQGYSGGISQIDFVDKERNEASIWYINENWKMTHTKIADFFQLPAEAQESFINARYNGAKIEDIYKTERAGMDKSLYTLHFKYRWKKVENMEHYVFINDDGMYLATLMSRPNDPSQFVNLPEDHFNFIAEKYSGAEIRGYVNNGGYHVYFISHKDTLKYVSLRGLEMADRDFWRETRYEISLDTEIPDNVAEVLERNHPDFVYTNLYYIESPEGNAYLFQDKNSDCDLGYIIDEDIKP
ncbi:hypothetical protein [uncultured Parabacteroides sp.]|uniref:hypothetical protein n=1 Tax=uncultured Parabacteroides sp. TaxID=512312 RepID=UPI0025E63A76|nr:hypothetical protein [uncultured Parabacteroides sp.]